jgi:hypothetical protein
VKLIGVQQRAKIAVVRRFSGGLGCFGLLLFWSDCGLVEGFGSGSPIKSLSLLLSAWISLPAVEGMVAKLEVRPNSLPIRLGGASRPPTEGIPRIASVRVSTMNRSATVEMLTRFRMVVLLSMRPTTACLRSMKSSQIVKEKN